VATAGPAVTSLAAPVATVDTILALAAGVLTVTAGVLLGRRTNVARALLASAFVSHGVGVREPLLTEPSAVILFGALAALAWVFVAIPPVARPVERRSAARVALAVAAIALLFVDATNLVALGCALAASALAFAATVRAVRGHRLRLGVFLVVLAGAVAVSAGTRDLASATSVVGLGELVAFVLLGGPALASSSLLDHPARVVVVSFAAVATFGTVVLGLPLSVTSGELAFVDAAFTSVSAVCVTGLVVVDTPTAFSGFGEVSLLALIQVGGLGTMAVYSLALSALGERLSLRHERALAGTLHVESRRRIGASLRRVVMVTLVSELVGAVALATSFALRHGDSFGTACWRGLFTAVSAFCNAGFALQTESLLPYAEDPVVLHVVALLVVIGGLSPVAVVAIPSWVRRRRVTLQVRLILAVSVTLLVGGALAYGLLEWEQSLAGLSLVDRIHNAWFQSVTLRTAGFQSVDLASTRASTQLLMLVLMFVGGSPGGTAGGIKTTTVAVLALLVRATMRGEARPTWRGREVGRRTVNEAASVFVVALFVLFLAMLAVHLTQRMPGEVATFEIVSALGTVGLSIGGTAMLDDVGKLLVIACMFIGRVGPLTLFLFLGERHGGRFRGTYPSTEITVG